MSLLGNGEGNTLVILTDAESRLIRESLVALADAGDSKALMAFNLGVVRGTVKLQQEFDELQRAKKAKQK